MEEKGELAEMLGFGNGVSWTIGRLMAVPAEMAEMVSEERERLCILKIAIR